MIDFLKDDYEIKISEKIKDCGNDVLLVCGLLVDSVTLNNSTFNYDISIRGYKLKIELSVSLQSAVIMKEAGIDMSRIYDVVISEMKNKTIDKRIIS